MTVSNADYVFLDGKAIRVEHPDGPDSWLGRADGERLLYRDGERYPVGRRRAERIANHPDNEYELVRMEESPFADE